MLKNPFKALNKTELVIWIISLLVVTSSLLMSQSTSPLALLSSLIGVTALIFLAKGDVWGQILSVVFAVLYAVVSIKFRYWGEAVTYLAMTAPSSAAGAVSWLKNPYKGNLNEVKIKRLSTKEKLLCAPLTAAVTVIFYFILRALDTPNLFFSTVSIATSAVASYLTILRSSYYAVAYSLNDIVLIVLWSLAAMQNPSYTPMIMCFVMFLVNDLYGFVSWRAREKKQNKEVYKRFKNKYEKRLANEKEDAII